MSVISLISALLPIISKVMNLLIKTDGQKLADISKKILDYVEELESGIKKEKANPGDTSGIEDAINRRR